MLRQKVSTQTVSQNIATMKYEELLQMIDNNLKQKFPKAIYYDSSNTLQIKDIDQFDEESNRQSENRVRQGRGGNNVAQNLKKSLKSIIKSKLSAELYEYFQAKYIKKHEIKSQKENFVLVFLFLHQLVHQKKLRPQLIQEIKECVTQNIHKYINNSESRKQYRQTFHSKNIKQFEKYLHFDIDFMRRRDFEEVQAFIKDLFLRKKVASIKAVEKVRKIVQESPFLNGIFFSENGKSIQKIEKSVLSTFS